jgi:hypothetical protein
MKMDLGSGQMVKRRNRELNCHVTYKRFGARLACGCAENTAKHVSGVRQRHSKLVGGPTTAWTSGMP